MQISNVNALANGMESLSKGMKEKKEVEDFQKKLEEAQSKEDDKALKEACKSFESYFVKKMLSEMRSTIQYSDLVKKSRGEEIFTEMLDDEYAKNIAEGEGIGLSKMLYEQLKKKAY